MDDAQMMGLREPFADLFGDRHGPARPELAGLPDELLQVLSRYELHGDEGRALGLPQVEHPADVPVTDPAGQLQLVREALDGLTVQGDLGPQQFEGDLLLDVGVEDLVDPTHAAVAEFLDDLVAAGEGRSGGQLMGRRLESLSNYGRMLLRRRELRAAPPAKALRV